MHVLLRGAAALVVIGLLVGTGPGMALAQEPLINVIRYLPEASSARPTAGGVGEFTYYPGTPTRSDLRSRFQRLAADAEYVVVVRGLSADSSPFTGTCGFRTDANGEGWCFADFTGLTGVVGSTVHQDSPDGSVALRMR